MHRTEKNAPNCHAMSCELLTSGRQKERVHNHHIHWKTEGTYTQPQYLPKNRRKMYTTTVVTGKDYGNVFIWRDGLCWDPQLQISKEQSPLFIAFMC